MGPFIWLTVIAVLMGAMAVTPSGSAKCAGGGRCHGRDRRLDGGGGDNCPRKPKPEDMVLLVLMVDFGLAADGCAWAEL